MEVVSAAGSAGVVVVVVVPSPQAAATTIRTITPARILVRMMALLSLCTSSWHQHESSCGVPPPGRRAGRQGSAGNKARPCHSALKDRWTHGEPLGTHHWLLDAIVLPPSEAAQGLLALAARRRGRGDGADDQRAARRHRGTSWSPPRRELCPDTERWVSVSVYGSSPVGGERPNTWPPGPWADTVHVIDSWTQAPSA